MTRFPYDQFAKDYLKELLQPLGEVETSRKVPAEIREIDVYYAPSPQSTSDKIELGLLGKLATEPALIEPFRNAATIAEIRSCINKLFDIFAEIKRQAKGDKNRIIESELPRLWILSPTASESILNCFRTSINEENWEVGVNFLGDYLRTAIVAIHQLPCTKETLWLRILGKGRVQQQAIDELEALPQDNPLRSKAIDLLLSLKTTLEVNQNVDEEDRNLIMRLSPIYEQKLAEAKQQGLQEGIQEGLQEGIQAERRNVIENLLQVRFGSLDAELRVIIEPLLALSPEEFTPLLLQLSREELLERFR
ncbi:hypothetical protein FNW02_01665 [Komarekiella sp. 'clone 1']|uniref:Flagellar assembly protein H n=1 Tax=Komarekiella delphini-convector SJRDD-AB1 TaxID=2593771 RepID=A0AA40STB4_9NOST|nr:Yae1 family protein [Komarekiella delphini-convector]MBD6614608.1 hypothetical protein [Komarekiella delphini-convector SJRDD-AB1]